jgi:hypothetical protein
VIAVAVLPLLLTLGLAALVWPHWRQFYAGLALGAAATMYAWAMDSPPEWIERKRRGRDGERRTERQLRPLEREGWAVAHDVDSQRGNFDHVVVGPKGAYLLETKTLRGRVTFGRDGMTVHRGDDERDSWRYVALDRGVRGDAAQLQRRLAPAGVRWVHPVVVLWCEFEEQVFEGDGVTFIHGKRLASWLRDQGDRLSDRVVEQTRPMLVRLEAGETRQPAGDSVASAS